MYLGFCNNSIFTSEGDKAGPEENLQHKIPEMTFVLIVCLKTDIIWRNPLYTNCGTQVVRLLLALTLTYLDGNERNGFSISKLVFKEPLYMIQRTWYLMEDGLMTTDST